MNDFEKIEEATDSALFEFWRAIVKAFPQSDSGDIDPLLDFEFNQKAREIVEQWYQWNVADRFENN
jgi:hypothetical protein